MQAKIIELSFAQSQHISTQLCNEVTQIVILKEDVGRNRFNNRWANEILLNRRQNKTALEEQK